MKKVLMERDMKNNGRSYIKKGPWSGEEDEILMNHVNKYGPRDWSSIRSKGLLPRTGKSCRLRWVNKLRPNLKTGCKFSVEEERVVIELQAQIGNKWAKIATYLEGRTDNDVKNFWSSRRKRLERMLHRSSHKKKLKASIINQPTLQEVPSCSSTNVEKKPSPSGCKYQSSPAASFHMENTEELKIDKPSEFQNVKAEEAILIHMVPPFECSSDYYNFSQVLPQPHHGDFSLLTDCHDDLAPVEPFNAVFLDIFEQQKVSDCECSTQKLETRLSGLAVEGNTQILSPANDIFEDFPTEIFDYFEDLPASSEK